MLIIEAERLMAQNSDALTRFIMRYLCDTGVGIHLIEAIARNMFGQTIQFQDGEIPDGMATAPIEMLRRVIVDLVVPGDFKHEASTNVVRIIEGAPSLAFIVRHARTVDPAIIPPEVIPDEIAVMAALTLFHYARRPN